MLAYFLIVGSREQLLGHPQSFWLVVWDTRIYISSKPLGDADAAGLGITL